MDISIVIPLLNESKSLPELYRWIDSVMDKNGYSYEIIFIDDGSTDGSWKVICGLKEKHGNIKGIKFRRNYGKSAALSEGFHRVEGDVVFSMDADLQDSPDELPALYKMITEDDFDLISGWKKKRQDPISKTVPSKLFNAVARKVSGIPLHDFNCGLKVYKKEVVKSIHVYGDMHRWMPVLAKWAGYAKIGEKIVAHRAREHGQSKFGTKRLISGFLDLLSLFFVGKFAKQPMHFFGTWGLGFSFIGFSVLVYLSLSKLIWKASSIDERPLFFLGILLLIIGTQLFVTGFLAELVARNNSEKDNYNIAEEI
ncbi:MAG: glycosyltransferase family 2 protein [Saprospiraceae bacterium]